MNLVTQNPSKFYNYASSPMIYIRQKVIRSPQMAYQPAPQLS